MGGGISSVCCYSCRHRKQDRYNEEYSLVEERPATQLVYFHKDVQLEYVPTVGWGGPKRSAWGTD